MDFPTAWRAQWPQAWRHSSQARRRPAGVSEQADPLHHSLAPGGRRRSSLACSAKKLRSTGASSHRRQSSWRQHADRHGSCRKSPADGYTIMMVAARTSSTRC